MQRAIRALKRELPELMVCTDVALDPYSSDGHDGVVIDGRIDNDTTLPILAAMAVSKGSASRRTWSAITTSSSEALPARSPIPLMVHST